MTIIDRSISEQIKKYLQKFPIVSVTGVRQCGKSTLLKNMFPDFAYSSLEDPDVRDVAINDPRGFLNQFREPCILDEVQQAPELFSYLQTIVDQRESMGQFILSGSHNFLLLQQISQSLAGRAAVLTLAPFSMKELKDAKMLPSEVDEMMLKGFYPAVYSRNLSVEEYFPSYVQTYIERDVRLIRNIPNANDFIRFVKLCAARSGQILNQTELANASGVSVPTVRAWLSVLLQSYLIFELPPFYNNYSKRLTKSPKLYFYDTGLLCYLLGIETAHQLHNHPLRGSVFETLIVSEYMKSCFFSARTPSGYFWRDSNQNEIDLLAEKNGEINAYEIKAGDTMNQKYLKTLKNFAKLADIPMENISCIYSGERTIKGTQGNFLNYSEVF